MSKRLGGFSGFSPPLQVVGFIGTRASDPERGPMVAMRPEDALIRLLTEGELVRVISERRQELAVLRLDDTLPKGGCVLRDVAGAAPADVIRVVRLDLESPRLA